MFLVIVIVSFLASAAVRAWLKKTYSRWSEIANAIGADGRTVARHILDSNDLQHVRLAVSEGTLSDHYIPSQELIRLSRDIDSRPSVASIAVAAHEVGHALQNKENYAWLKLKAVLMPFAAVGNKAGLFLAIGSGMMGSTLLMNAGLLLMLLGMLMPLLTLPIEFDASKRALQQLIDLRLVTESEYDGAKSVLRAAAFTYVAGAAQSTAILALLVFRFLRR
ncbi:MAG: zinc metallopeptidase [Pseudomonadota bacterium]